MRRRFSTQQEIVLWSHIGLGDTIAIYPAVERWTQAGRVVHLPAREKYVTIVRELFSSLNGVTIFPVPNDGLELDAVRAYSQKHSIPVFYAGYYLYLLLKWAGVSLGLNGILNHLASHAGPLVSISLREHLLADKLAPAKESRPSYAFVDHHVGTEREIPASYLTSALNGFEVKTNNLQWSLAELAQEMDAASCLHLVSSAPLCLALVADLGSGKPRFRYRVQDFHPLKSDYPADWVELSINSAELTEVDRTAESQPTRLAELLLKVFYIEL